MNDIDWSKAPEEATHYFLEQEKPNREYWVKQTPSKLYFCRLGHEADGFRPWLCDFQRFLSSMVARPSPAWNGEGLPPVGTVCEYMWNYKPEGSEYVQVEILVHDKGSAVVRSLNWPSPGVLRESAGGYCGPGRGQPIFRPIRTPEQIAADEREAAIEEMWKVYWRPEAPTAKEALGLLYDAGYRKQ